MAGRWAPHHVNPGLSWPLAVSLPDKGQGATWIEPRLKEFAVEVHVLRSMRLARTGKSKVREDPLAGPVRDRPAGVVFFIGGYYPGRVCIGLCFKLFGYVIQGASSACSSLVSFALVFTSSVASGPSLAACASSFVRLPAGNDGHDTGHRE